jgi:translocation and assembly module TamA
VSLLLLVYGAFVSVDASAEVILNGVTERQSTNIKAFLSLAELGCDAPSWLVRWQYRQADTQVASALEALGYYESRTVDSLDFPTDGCWRAQFDVTPGEPVIVRSVSIRVDDPLGSEESIRNHVTAARDLEDKPLDHAQYESIKRGLLEAARALGYFDASFTTSEVRVDVGERSASVTIAFVGGTRYRFGEVDVVGDMLERRLIDAYIPFRAGDPFDAALITRVRRNLADSGYFGASFVTADPDTAVDHVVPVRIELTPRRRAWTYSFGVGYATDTGPRVRADIDNELLNPQGHRASVKTVISRERTSLDAQYRIPHINPANDWFIFDGGLAHLDPVTYTSDIKRIGARHSYQRGDWVETDFVDLTYEDFKIADEFGSSRLLLFGTTLSRFWRNQPTRPTEGYRLDATVRTAAQALGSDTDLVQLLSTAKAIERISDSTRVLARTTAGWTLKGRIADLPPTIRFFAGGDTSIRGYAYQDVGPERNGNVVGGSRMLTGSLEFDYLFRANWSVAAFVDSGSAFDDEPHFVTGVGVGLRWYSPVGPIRVDVAHPLDDPTTQWRLYVTIGPDL